MKDKQNNLHPLPYTPFSPINLIHAFTPTTTTTLTTGPIIASSSLQQTPPTTQTNVQPKVEVNDKMEGQTKKAWQAISVTMETTSSSSTSRKNISKGPIIPTPITNDTTIQTLPPLLQHHLANIVITQQNTSPYMPLSSPFPYAHHQAYWPPQHQPTYPLQPTLGEQLMPHLQQTTHLANNNRQNNTNGDASSRQVLRSDNSPLIRNINKY